MEYFRVWDCKKRRKRVEKNRYFLLMFDALSLCLAVFGPARGVRMSGNAVPMCVVTFSLHSSVLFGPFLCLGSSSLTLFCPACFKKPFRLLGFVWDWILCIKRCSARVEGEMTGQSPRQRGAETAPHKQRIRYFFTSSVERYLILPCRRAKNNKGIHGAIK